MRSVHLSDLRGESYSLRKVIAHMQYWREGSTWLIQEGGRINTAIMALVGLEADYVNVADQTVLATVKPGDLAIIPQGLRYEFVCRSVEQGQNNLEDLPEGNYYWNGIKEDGENISRSANAVFLGFELFDDNGKPFTLGSRIHVIHPPQSSKFFQIAESIARMSGSSFTPPALIAARMYELLTRLSESAFTKHQSTSAYQRVEPALRYMEEHPAGSISVEMLSKVCNLSSSGFRRLFRQVMGISPIDYVQKQTMSRAMNLLSVGELSITEAALECGFQDAFYFSRFFRKHTGMSPSAWRKAAMDASPLIQNGECRDEI